jgi:hypothetical protein
MSFGLLELRRITVACTKTLPGKGTKRVQYGVTHYQMGSRSTALRFMMISLDREDFALCTR